MLNKQNFAIAELASTDPEAQPIFQGLHVSPERTCVTDGHLAVIVGSYQSEEEPGLFDDAEGVEPADAFTPFTLDRESALKIAKAIPKKTENKSARFGVVDQSTENNDRAMVSVNDSLRQEILRSRKIEGEYPALDKVFGDPGPAIATIALDADLLARVAKAASSFCNARNAGRITLRIFGPESPITLVASSDEQCFSAAIAPMRAEAPNV